MTKIIFDSKNHCVYVEVRRLSNDLVQSLHQRLNSLEQQAPSDSYIVLSITEKGDSDFQLMLTINFLKGPIINTSCGGNLSQCLDDIFSKTTRDLNHWKSIRFLKMKCA